MVKNVYKLPCIQEKLPKQKDEQVAFTGMKLNRHALICGQTGAGKSQVLLHYLAETSKPKTGTFRHIFVCYKTDEPIYDLLREKLGPEGISFYRSVAEFPDVRTFPDAVTNDYKYQYLCVFDDCVQDKDKKSYTKIKEYATFSRKKGITMFILSQSYTETDIFLRRQMGYVLLMSCKNRTELQNILKNYSLDCSMDELRRVFKEATAPDRSGDPDDPSFLKIDCCKTSPETMFSRDWLDYIPVKTDDESSEAVEEGSEDENDDTPIKKR